MELPNVRNGAEVAIGAGDNLERRKGCNVAFQRRVLNRGKMRRQAASARLTGEGRVSGDVPTSAIGAILPATRTFGLAGKGG